MIKCSGVAVAVTPPGQTTHKMDPVPKAPKPHPVETVAPRANVPFELIVISCPEEVVSVDPVALKLNEKPLSTEPTLPGLALLAVSVMSRVPAPKVRVAVELASLIVMAFA